MIPALLLYRGTLWTGCHVTLHRPSGTIKRVLHITAPPAGPPQAKISNQESSQPAGSFAKADYDVTVLLVRCIKEVRAGRSACCSVFSLFFFLHIKFHLAFVSVFTLFDRTSESTEKEVEESFVRERGEMT